MAESSQQTDYVNQVKAENENLDPAVFVHASRLLTEEIERVEKGLKYVDLAPDKKTKLAVKVQIPADKFPKLNIVGRLLGPGGNTLKMLQSESGCRMSICGRGSMRDKTKEEELRKSDDAKYAHLSEDLHLLVEVFSGASDSYSRMSVALASVGKYFDPNYDPDTDTMIEGGAYEHEGRQGPVPSARGAPRGGRGGGAAPLLDPYARPAADPYMAPRDDPYAHVPAHAPPRRQEFDYGAGGDFAPRPSYPNGDGFDSGYGKAPAPRGRGGDRSRPYTTTRGGGRGGERGGGGRGAPRGRGGDRGGRGGDRGRGAPRGRGRGRPY